MATKPRAVRRWLGEWILTGLMLLCWTTTLVQAFVVPTPLMDTTIQVGDHLLVDKLVDAPVNDFPRSLLPYSEVKLDDVIVFKYPLDEVQPYVKRVIGVPGDRIRFADNQFILNGRAVDEPYKLRLPYPRNFSNEAGFPGIATRAPEIVYTHVVDGDLVVPAGMYFAMGDNRDDSTDSRFWGLCRAKTFMASRFWCGGPTTLRRSIGSRRTLATFGIMPRTWPSFFYEDSLEANVSANYFVSTWIAHGKD